MDVFGGGREGQLRAVGLLRPMDMAGFDVYVHEVHCVDSTMAGLCHLLLYRQLAI